MPSRVSDSCVGWGWRGLGKDIMGFWVFDSDSGELGICFMAMMMLERRDEHILIKWGREYFISKRQNKKLLLRLLPLYW